MSNIQHDPELRQRYIEHRDRYRAMPRIRPVSIQMPGPGQESVWDYPRPPRVEPVSSPLRVEHGGVVIAQTTRGLRVLETASPPAYYFPLADVHEEYLKATSHTSFCEWKGIAYYAAVQVGDRRAANAAWVYPFPEEGYEAIKDYFAFYPQRLDACFVGDEQVRPQPGQFYGGWITANICGPFKGEPGSENW